MSIVIQLLILLLVIISIILTVGIPVTLASSEKWEKSKSLVFTGASLWGFLVIITGVINSLAT
uniref:Photosystem II reaction center protein Z n=1 Tax=Hildenbrandia rivularis TaxID=135206 RepID=A0A1C9CFD0_9FLOR|nr:photosystem II protein Z [Hildenbrandia rivularis]AOM67062.1 photosystem II protein Z [Hildenbrandia rivularis]